MNGRCCSETADAQANHSPTRFQVWPFLLGSTKVCTQIKNKIHPESLNHPAKGIFGVSRSMLWQNVANLSKWRLTNYN